jgi:predicted ATPase
VTCRLTSAFALWNLGYPAQAQGKIHEALNLAQELTHSYSLALASLYAGVLHQFRHEEQATQNQGETVRVFSSEQGFPLLSARATILQGWALATQGEAEEGIAQICQGMAALRTIGVEHGQSHFLALLAEAYGKKGQIKEGLTVLAEALNFVSQTEERFYEAELYRLKGELLLAQEIKNQKLKDKDQKSENLNPNSQLPDPNSEAEACFRKAIDIARKQQAKSWELRAVMSLARLRQHQAAQSELRITDHELRTRLAEAHQVLSEVYNWFTEGFDTKDLQEAKSLIEELSC